MKYPDLNSANSYLFTLEWRKYFWVFDLFGSFIAEGNLDKKYVATVNIRFSCKWWFATEKVKNGACRIEALSKCQTLWEYPIEITKIRIIKTRITQFDNLISNYVSFIPFVVLFKWQTRVNWQTCFKVVL